MTKFSLSMHLTHPFKNKQDKATYISICELTFGCVPVYVHWALGTAVYKQMQTKLQKKHNIK